MGLRDRFRIWAEATRKAILGEYDDPKLFLPGLERDLPPTVKRRLREHRKEIDEHESFLNRRVQFESAAVEPLGVLLRVPAPGGPALKPLTFAGEGFSEYFCTQLLGTDPQLRTWLDTDAAEATYKKASAVVRSAQRSLRDREQAAQPPSSSCNHSPICSAGGSVNDRGSPPRSKRRKGACHCWRPDADRILARAVCIAPDAHLDAAPPGLHRRFAPSLSLTRVLRESALTYGVLLNAFELRLVCVAGYAPLVDRIRPHGDRRRDVPRSRYLEAAPCTPEAGCARPPSPWCSTASVRSASSTSGR